MSRLRRGAVLAGFAAMVLGGCVGCRGGLASGSTPAQQVPPPATTATDGSAAQLNSQLDGLQSTLDSVQAQVNADSSP
ncbi:MAG TPA: hypothetical protein VHW44_28075 [Pseudonocardiaceae bacterium]|nr:hypothetical protein [Pseudonocardiaceae bacterium]